MAAADFIVGARESVAVGIKQIFSPMVDVSDEPSTATTGGPWWSPA